MVIGDPLMTAVAINTTIAIDYVVDWFGGDGC